MSELEEYKDFLKSLNDKLSNLSTSCSAIVSLYDIAPEGLKTAYSDKLNKIATRKKFDKSRRGQFFNLFRSLPRNIKASGIAAAQLTTAAGVIAPAAIVASPFVGLYNMTRGGGKKTQKQKKQKNRKRTKKI